MGKWAPDSSFPFPRPNLQGSRKARETREMERSEVKVEEMKVSLLGLSERLLLMSYEYPLRQLWDVELCLPPSPPVPENNVWGNPEQASTGLWKWLPLRGHSLQSLYSPPPLGQHGDRDKITHVLQSWQQTCLLTYYPNKYTWKGWGGKTTAARIIPTWFRSKNVLPRRNTWFAPVQYSGGWESISAHQHINSRLCWMMRLLRLWRQRAVPEAGLIRLEWGSWPLSLDFICCQHGVLNEEPRKSKHTGFGVIGNLIGLKLVYFHRAVEI